MDRVYCLWAVAQIRKEWKKTHNKSVIYYRKVKHNGGLSAAQLFSVQCINQSGSRGSFKKTFYTWNKIQLLTHLPALPRREQDPSRFMVNTIRFKVTVCKISPLETAIWNAFKFCFLTPPDFRCIILSTVAAVGQTTLGTIHLQWV